jgi:hypothetical protein
MLALTVADEIRSGLAILSDEEIEADANRLWSKVSDVADVEDLARARKVKIEPDRALPDGIDGLALPHALVVRPSRQRALWVLRILHELAHHLLGRSRAHTHADTWRLTLALAWPARRIKDGLPCLEIPEWARMLRVLCVQESRMIPAA